jgi:acetyl-CoA C-acetyltransferase
VAIDVPGVQLDRRCGSGLAAICFAAMEVQTGTSDVVLAGGFTQFRRATETPFNRIFEARK